jgi:FixJ family two-component response regulator
MNSSRVSVVYVVEDDQFVQEAIRQLLLSERGEVRGYASPRLFLSEFDGANPGCIVLDLKLPEMDGLEVQRALQQRGVTMPVIMLTAHGDVPAASAAFRAGVIDFITKPFDPAELQQRVREAVEKDRRQRAFLLQGNQRRAIQRLSEREREVASMVTMGLASKQIALRLGVTQRTVEFHRSNIMKKLGASSMADVIRAWVLYHLPS